MLNKLTISLIFSFLLSQDYPVLGSSQSLDFMTWNVENYPKHNQTNSYMIDIINQINIDIIAFQEIENQNSFNNLINQLNGNWIGYRADQNSNWGELSYAINLDEIEVIEAYNILNQDQSILEKVKKTSIKIMDFQFELLLLQTNQSNPKIRKCKRIMKAHYSFSF